MRKSTVIDLICGLEVSLLEENLNKYFYFVIVLSQISEFKRNFGSKENINLFFMLIFNSFPLLDEIMNNLYAYFFKLFTDSINFYD